MKEMPQPHFSWSQLDCYTRNPEEYFMRYVLGVKEEPTAAMRLGSIVHEAIEGSLSEQGWRDALAECGFTPDYARALAAALPNVPKPQAKEMEVRIDAPGFAHKGAPVQLLSIFDGLDLEPAALYEWKTGSPWTQERVDDHEQLTFYAFVHKQKFGRIPRKMSLSHINMKNGKVTTFQTSRSASQVAAFVRERLKPTMTLISKGVFNRL